MINPDKFLDDGETSVRIDVKKVTKEEVDRADEFLEELLSGGEINGKL